MCPPDQTEDDPDAAAAASADADAANDRAEAAREPNKVVGDLTDDELKAGGMDRVTAYVRSPRSKEAKRKTKQREKQQKAGKRQINIVVRDDERSRTTMRAAAAAIDDEVVHRAVAAILVDSAMPSFVTKVAARPELRDVMELCQQPVTPAGADLAQLINEHSMLAALIRRAIATKRSRQVVEMALAHPKFVSLGRKIATGNNICVRVARFLLRIRWMRGAGSG
jgi:hypothetical protein